MLKELQIIIRRIVPLYLTYDSKQMTDGFGAQGARIMGIFSVARFFKLGYLHNPISDISDVNELMGASDKQIEYEGLLAELNTYISFPQDKFPSRNPNYFSVYNLGFRNLLYFYIVSLIFRKVIILKVCLPFGITDRFPIITYQGKKTWDNLRNPIIRSRSDEKIVVMHIRASEHSPDKKRPQLGPSYYRQVLDEISQNLNGKFKLKVHTDFFATDFIVSEKSTRVKVFESFLSECEKLPNCQVNHYADIRQVMVDMIEADILVMSRSALPYLAGILSSAHVIFPGCHGHAPLPNWHTRRCEDFISGG